MPREGAEAKGKRYVCEGRLTIRLVNGEEIRATAKGDGELYELGLAPGRGWFCSCPAVTDQCSHLKALRLVTVRGERPGFFPARDHERNPMGSG
jgi:uncharacterized Zn finger protein